MPRNILISFFKSCFKEANLYRSLLIISIFFTPICFLFFFQNAFFSHIGSVDPIIYAGYGYNYADPSFLSTYYKISRLPWVLVQFIFRTLLNIDFASVALHFTIYATASYLIFKITEKISGILPAFMLAILTPLFLNFYSGGPDYHNNFSAILFLALILHINSGKDNTRNFFLITGALYALVIHTNILLSLDALVYGSAFYAAAKINRGEKIFSGIVKKIIFILSGFFLCTLAFCIINYCFGRDFLFMKPLWNFMRPGNNVSPMNNWERFISDAKYLSHFTALFFYSVFLVSYLFFKKLHRKNILLFLLNLAFIFSAGEAFLTQSFGLNNLYIKCFAFGILIPFLLTFSANLGFIFNNKNLSLSARQMLVLAVAGAIFLALILLNISTIYSGNFFFKKSSFLDMSAIWLLLLGASFIFRKKLNYFSASILVLIYFLVAALTVSHYPGLHYFGLNYFIDYKKNDHLCNQAKSMSSAYVEFNHHVKKYRAGADSDNIFAWWNKDQNLSYNPCFNKLPDSPNSITLPSQTIIAATSGFSQPLDDPWLEGGMNKIDDLWKTADSKEIWNKTHFLSEKEGPRILILISYDDNDVHKMIKKMKQYKINFSYVEKRRILADAFTLQYYVLKEEKAE